MTERVWHSEFRLRSTNCSRRTRRKRTRTRKNKTIKTRVMKMSKASGWSGSEVRLGRTETREGENKKRRQRTVKQYPFYNHGCTLCANLDMIIERVQIGRAHV